MTIEELLKYAEKKTHDYKTDETLAEILPELIKINIVPTKALVDILINSIDSAIDDIRDSWGCS